MHIFKELDCWKYSRILVKDVYDICKTFPASENYRLVSQMTRCAVSIPSNIAEGCGRDTDKQTIQFLSIALGSSYELETQLILSYDLGYITKLQVKEIVEETQRVQRIIHGFKKKLEQKSK